MRRWLLVWSIAVFGIRLSVEIKRHKSLHPFGTRLPNMILNIDICIQQSNETSNRQNLLALSGDSSLGVGTNFVYIYSLVDESVNYPNKEGKVVYIGKTGRTKEPTGKRFGQHISTTADKGGDLGTIYALSRYYWKGSKLRLQIFSMRNEEEITSEERKLLKCHVKEYGSLPICQGTTGRNYKTSELASLDVADQQLALL